MVARRLDLKEELRTLLTTHPRLAPRFAAATPLTPITGFGLPLGGTARPVHGPRWLLCGDAAALIDPLQGHGIDKAVQSGILAAGQVRRCFQAQRFDADFLAEYARQVDHRIGRELRRRYCLMRFLAGKAWLVNLAVGAAWPWLRRRLVRAVG